MSNTGPTYTLGPDFRKRLRAFVDEILGRGAREFAQELDGIDDYVKKAISSGSEEGLRKTPPPEYLLELISFQILDDLNREAFNKTKETLIVMPDCLSIHNPDCLREEGKWGDQCLECVENCQASKIVELAEKYGAHTIFSKRKLVEQLTHYKEELGSMGVIGVACIKMLAMGMRSASEVPVPSRGVLLNFSGCEHWNDQPCASEFAMEWLEEILREKHG